MSNVDFRVGVNNIADKNPPLILNGTLSDCPNTTCNDNTWVGHVRHPGPLPLCPRQREVLSSSVPSQANYGGLRPAVFFAARGRSG